MSLPWTDLIREIGSAVRQVLPNPQAQAEFDMKMLELAAQAEARENDLMLAQVEVNKTEATHANLFVAGWRPFIGWVCGAACAWNWIGISVVRTALTIYGNPLELKAADVAEMMPVLLGLLGLGAMRMNEKIKGVAAK